MINLSNFSTTGFIGKILRFPLRLIPRRMVMPVWQGRLRGKKWIVGSGVHGYWLGTYECEKQHVLTRAVKAGAVFYDIGGHAGFFAMLASVLVGPRGHVVVFEPFPVNIHFLKEHVRINRCGNVRIIEAAVAERAGVQFFEKAKDTYTGCLSSGGAIKVNVVSLDDLVMAGEIKPPDYLKIDVEGAEFLVLSGARQILSKHHPMIFLSTHNKKVHEQCCAFLGSLGYKLKPLIGTLSIDDTDEIVAYE
jgi:FkbM family methyltransferase